MAGELSAEDAFGLFLAAVMFASFVVTGLYLVTLNHLAKAIQRETPTLWEEWTGGRRGSFGPPPFASRILLGDRANVVARLGVASQPLAIKCRRLFVLGGAGWIASISLLFTGRLLF